jgi:hypothetical protein
LLAHGRWFSPGTSASSTTKTGRHDIAEILLKVALKHQKSNQSINQSIEFSIFLPNKFMQYFDLQSFVTKRSRSEDVAFFYKLRPTL